MLKFNVYSNLLKNRMYRLLFLVFISAFALYPVFDAYADSLNSSVLVNDMDDDYGGDDHVAFHVLKAASQDYHAACNALFHRFSATDSFGFQAFDRTTPATHVKFFKTCPPLSSDPSPPVS